MARVDPSHTPMVSVVTVTFNSEDHIRECLDSVARAFGTMSLEHIVVDNASKDGTAAIMQGEFPHVVFIQNAVNRGLTAANNQGQDVLPDGRLHPVWLRPGNRPAREADRSYMGGVRNFSGNVRGAGKV